MLLCWCHPSVGGDAAVQFVSRWQQPHSTLCFYYYFFFKTQYQLQPSRQEHVDRWGLFWVFTGNFFHQHSRLVVYRCHFSFGRTTPSSQSFPKRRRRHIDYAAHRGESRGAFLVHLMDFYGLLAVVTCDLVAVTPIEILWASAKGINKRPGEPRSSLPQNPNDVIKHSAPLVVKSGDGSGVSEACRNFDAATFYGNICSIIMMPPDSSLTLSSGPR